MPFKLENEFYRLEVIPEAAEITSFFDKTNNVEIMYQGDEGWSGRNPSLFPIIGSTYSKYYEIHGKQYTMKNHGLARYATFKGEQLEDKLIFTFCSDEETLKQYPFDFVFEIAYSLEGKTLHIDYTIKNTSKEDMPYSFGLHPAFRVPQYKNEKFEDYSIDFEFNEEATQLVFDPSFNENIKEKKVQLNSWKLSREDINHYATLVYKDYKSLQQFLRKQPLLQEFTAFAASHEVQRKPKEIKESAVLLNNYIESYIARNIIGDNAFYPIFLQEDKTFQKALDVLNANQGFPQAPDK